MCLFIVFFMISCARHRDGLPIHDIHTAISSPRNMKTLTYTYNTYTSSPFLLPATRDKKTKSGKIKLKSKKKKKWNFRSI